ncbi:MBL fold metallo-hydrolase [Yinghuangia seranimata]|uniref:MBL fold metallo-hydrolase n=1 Tax=Yinghuangia seranimata TaxID=408067 RepID=UPI00248AD6A3|nr:MBL fold metallo-hydrolase [Yinghuangia seranimata]MDI2125717.1 MBL fold metallo-hydrolase [Yinghuangia seranimata]
MQLNLTKLGHSCVRVEAGGVTLVLDPGAFSDPDAMEGADAILVTHEHFDHVVPDRLRAALDAKPDLEVWTNPAVAAQFADLGGRVHAVAHGDVLDIGGVPVHVYGAKHASIHRDIPLVDNVGFLVGGEVFHPGDALTVPEEPVATLLTPAAAPWLKVAEAVDYVREVAPRRALLIHDAVLSDAGREVHTRLLTGLTENPDRTVALPVNGQALKLG